MSDALKAAAIVIALWAIVSAAVGFGYAKGLRDAPAYLALQEDRARADDAAWSRILDAVAADDTCRRIRDLILADEADREAGSPHND